MRTLAEPRHSREFGGAAPDALLVLLHALATLHDGHGDVTVAGPRREAWMGASHTEDEFRELAGVEPGLPLWSGWSGRGATSLPPPTDWSMPSSGRSRDSNVTGAAPGDRGGYERRYLYQLSRPTGSLRQLYSEEPRWAHDALRFGNTSRRC